MKGKINRMLDCEFIWFIIAWLLWLLIYSCAYLLLWLSNDVKTISDNVNSIAKQLEIDNITITKE